MKSSKLPPYLVSAYLADLNRSNTQIQASALISNEGLILASELPQQVNEHRVAALSAALAGQSDLISQTLSAGALNHLLLNSPEHKVLVVRISQEALLTVVFDNTAQIKDSGFSDMAWAITASTVDELRYLYNTVEKVKGGTEQYCAPLAMAY